MNNSTMSAGSPVHEGAITERCAIGRLSWRQESHPPTTPSAAATRQRPEVLSRDAQCRTETRVRVVLHAT